MCLANLKLGLLILMTGIAKAQTEAPPRVTVRSTTTLVQVGVSAHDSNGRVLSYLKKEDFELFDNGKPQPIVVFHAPTTPDAMSAAAPPTAHPGVRSNRLPPETYRGGAAVVLLDWSNTGFRNTARAREQAREAIAKLNPSDSVGLYSLDHTGLKVVNEIGSDRETVLNSIKTVTGLPAPCFQRQLDNMDDPFEDSMDNCGGTSTLALNVKNFWVAARITNTLRVFEAIAGHLAGIPGRKALIWVSSAFPLKLDLRPNGLQVFPDALGGVQLFDAEVSRALTKLNNAGVSLYPIDSRGLSSESVAGSDDDYTWPTMDYFAARTGGVAYHGGNGIGSAIQAAIEDVDATYTLGFYASDSSRTGVHRLNVRSTRPGIKLHYKQDYANVPKKISKEDRDAAVGTALTAVTDATAVPIDIEVSREQNSLKLRISLRPDTLALVQKGSRWQGAVYLITRFAREDGTECALPAAKRIEFDLTQRTYDAGLREGLSFLRIMQIPAKADRLRLLVRNDPSGEMGTLTVPLAMAGR